MLKLKITLKQAEEMVFHNFTRGLIELICDCAHNLGYDALYGHEVDRHSDPNKVLAQPWLAVFKKGAVSEPIWT